MKKFWIFLTLTLLLAACSQSPDQEAETPAPPATTAAVAPTVASAPTPAPTETDQVVEAAAGCTLQTILAPPDATEASLFPPVTAADDQVGPETAATTIVEYGDFQ